MIITRVTVDKVATRGRLTNSTISTFASKFNNFNDYANVTLFNLYFDQVRIAFLGIPDTLRDFIFRNDMPHSGFTRYSLGKKGELFVSRPLDIMIKQEREELWDFMLQLNTSVG